MNKNVRKICVDKFGDLVKSENLHAAYDNAGKDAGNFTWTITYLARPHLSEESCAIIDKAFPDVGIQHDKKKN